VSLVETQVEDAGGDGQDVDDQDVDEDEV
jgi:hypothetical protein